MKQSDIAKSDDEIINKLFQDAAKYVGDYIFTLLRVGGIESYKKEPLAELAEKIEQGKATKQDVESSIDLWSLFTNLCRLQREVHYMPFPFKPDETDYKTAALQLHVSGSISDRLKELTKEENPQNELDFIARFLAHYRAALKEFAKENHTVFPVNGRMFEVFEVLADKNNGLNGFKVHFSNDSSAHFVRTATGTDGANVIPGNSIDFFVGENDKLKPAWRVSGKWLYEVGFEGRYNEPGEWKPLVYPGKSDVIQKEALDATDDERVQGVLFYMLATGHPVIEFAVKMPVKLPEAEVVLPGNVNLLLVEQENQLGNLFVYDGWVDLKDTSLEGVRLAIEGIQRAMEGIAFAFDKEVRWRLKYSLHDHTRGAANPNKKDMEFLDSIISNSAKEQDLAIDAAINWYNLGNLTQNPLNAFLCFHIAIEGLAAKLAQGKLKASATFGLAKENKTDRKERIKTVFDEYYATYYSAGNIEEMIKQSYFVGVVPIKNYLHKALEAVFPEKGRKAVLDTYFKKDEGIWDLRGKLVHDVYSDWHPEEFSKVQGKLYELEELAKAFITRVALRIPPDQKRPQWSRRHSLASNMDNPKSTLIVSPDLRMLPRTDWKILPEWID
jgi:hypothetical protein